MRSSWFFFSRLTGLLVALPLSSVFCQVEILDSGGPLMLEQTVIIGHNRLK